MNDIISSCFKFLSDDLRIAKSAGWTCVLAEGEIEEEEEEGGKKDVSRAKPRDDPSASKLSTLHNSDLTSRASETNDPSTPKTAQYGLAMVFIASRRQSAACNPIQKQ